MHDQRHVITIGDDHFIVHMRLHDGFMGYAPSTAQADVYDAIPWTDSNGNAGVSYMALKDGTSMDEVSEKCRMLFGMTACWRGCWDERCYPRDKEYWDGEFARMAAIEAHIKPILRKLICDVNDKATPTD